MCFRHRTVAAVYDRRNFGAHRATLQLIERRLVRIIILAAVVVLGLGIFCLCMVPIPREPAIGSARLVSIEELAEMCPPEPPAGPQENNLFAAFQDSSVAALPAFCPAACTELS